jgi:hypothetical protein
LATTQTPVAVLSLRQFKRIADVRGKTLAFEAAGALECDRDITPEIQDWWTGGIRFAMGSIGLDTLYLSQRAAQPK